MGLNPLSRLIDPCAAPAASSAPMSRSAGAPGVFLSSYIIVFLVGLRPFSGCWVLNQVELHSDSVPLFLVLWLRATFHRPQRQFPLARIVARELPLIPHVEHGDLRFILGQFQGDFVRHRHRVAAALLQRVHGDFEGQFPLFAGSADRVAKLLEFLTQLAHAHARPLVLQQSKNAVVARIAIRIVLHLCVVFGGKIRH